MRRLPASIAACACLLAACGDDEGGGRTVTVPAGAGVDVVADEYSFDPGRIVVNGAGAVEIRLDNRGSLAHNLKVLEGDRELGGTPSFPGGEQRQGRVTLEPGEYRMVCTVGDHEELGMVGTFTVTGKD